MAKDIIHDAVKNALIKDNWVITHDPFRVEYEELEIFADLAVEKTSYDDSQEKWGKNHY
jgi:hypothetical protein